MESPTAAFCFSRNRLMPRQVTFAAGRPERKSADTAFGSASTPRQFNLSNSEATRAAVIRRACGLRGHRSCLNQTIRQQWHLWGQGVDLVVLSSPYRSLMEPLLEYIEGVQRDAPTGYVTVILPEFAPRRLWHHLLHNQHALLIKGALLFKPNVIVTSVPFHLGRRSSSAAGPASGGDQA